MNKKSIIIYCALAILLAVSFIISLWPLQMSHWWDEAVYLQHSEIIFSGVDNYNEFELRPPVLPMLFAAGYIIKHHMFTASVITSLLGTLGVLFTFLVGKKLYNEEIGLLSALFLGLSPFTATASHWIMTDMPSLSFIIISFYLAVLAVKRNSKWFVLFSGIMFGVAILTRFTSLILAFVIPLYLLINGMPWKRLALFAIGLGATLSPYLVWAQIRFGFFIMPFINANMAVASTDADSLLYYFFHFFNVYGVVIVLGVVIHVIYRLLRVRPTVNKTPFDVLVQLRIRLTNHFSRDDLVLGLWIVMFLAFLTITPHKEERYILPISLPLYLLSARGYNLLLEHRKPVTKAIAWTAIFILAIGTFSSAFSRVSEPFINTVQPASVQAASYLKTLNPTSNQTIVVYANNDYPVYAYFSGMKVVRLNEVDQTFYTTYPANMPDSGYFVYDKNLAKEPTGAWLNKTAAFTKIKDFENLALYAYTP